METHYKRNYKNFYPFIRAALVNEAAFFREVIILDYITENGFAYQFFYPNGSKLFNTKEPTAVDFIAIEHHKKYLNKRFDCLHFFINPFFNDYEIQNDNIYGVSFVEELIKRNEDAYLNYILGEKQVEIKVLDRKDDELYRSAFERKVIREESLVLSVEGNDDKLYIHESTPERLSNQNMELFRRYVGGYKLNDNYKGAALILGNGVSIPFGSDSWDKLIDHFLDALAPYHIDDANRMKNMLSKSTYALSSFVKNTLKRDGLMKIYNETLYSSIYRKYHSLMKKEETLAKVIAQSKYKYTKMPIYTYNYDTFVEQQFYYEFKKDLKHYLSYEYKNNPYDGVIHLHGYIGYHSKTAKEIVLTDKDYFDAYLASSGSSVKDAQTYALSNYKCLFVGSSMSDLFQMSVIQEVAKKNGKNWCCFALMCFRDLSLSEKIQLIRYYREKGIYIILAKDFYHMPEVLKDLIC